MHKITKAGMSLTLFAAFFFNIFIADYIGIAGIRPDALTLVVIFLGIFFGGRTGLVYGLVAGLLKDIYTYDLLGVNMLVVGFTGLSAGVVSTRFFRESKSIRTLLVLFFSFFSMWLHFVIASFASAPLNITMAEYLRSYAAPSGIYTSVISIPIFAKLMDIYHLNENHELL